MEKLNAQEIELLMDSLDALDSRKLNDVFQDTMFSAMLRPSPTPESSEQISQRVKAKMEQARSEGALLRERTILLRAKLIMMKQSMAADRLADSVDSSHTQGSAVNP